MALSLVLANVTVNAEADAAGALLNSGKLWLYSGAKPANPETAPTSQVILATLTFPGTAFAPATLGVITANTIASVTASVSSTCLWFRAVKSDNTPILDGTVGTTGTNLVLNAVDIVAGANVSISSLSWTAVKN